MPCYVSESENLFAANEIRIEITTFLCQACKLLTDNQMKEILYISPHGWKSNLYQWNLAHTLDDKSQQSLLGRGKVTNKLTFTLINPKSWQDLFDFTNKLKQIIIDCSNKVNICLLFYNFNLYKDSCFYLDKFTNKIWKEGEVGKFVGIECEIKIISY